MLLFDDNIFFINILLDVELVTVLVQDINEEWISDKTRFCYDGLKRQRLSDPMIRDSDGRFKAVSWRDALAVVGDIIHQVKPDEIVGVAGQLSDAESMMVLKDFVNRMGSDNVWCEGTAAGVDADLRYSYLMNTSISGLENADLFLLIGTQVRFPLCLFCIVSGTGLDRSLCIWNNDIRKTKLCSLIL